MARHPHCRKPTFGLNVSDSLDLDQELGKALIRGNPPLLARSSKKHLQAVEITRVFIDMIRVNPIILPSAAF
jgi:hypothetical protein